MKKRRQYSREFKIQAVKMVTEQGLSVTEVGRDLGINPNLVCSWRKKFQENPDSSFPGHGKLTPEQQELRQLRQEVQQLRMERDILKKATAFFASQEE